VEFRRQQAVTCDCSPAPLGLLVDDMLKARELSLLLVDRLPQLRLSCRKPGSGVGDLRIRDLALGFSCRHLGGLLVDHMFQARCF